MKTLSSESNSEVTDEFASVKPESTLVLPTRDINLRVSWLPIRGVPTYLMPLRCFDEDTPFALCGKFGPHAADKYYNRRMVMTLEETWNVVALYRLCGYDVELLSTESTDRWRPYAPNDTQLIWPHYNDPDKLSKRYSVRAIHQREKHFIDLPDITNVTLRTHEFSYKVEIVGRGLVKPENAREYLDIADGTVTTVTVDDFRPTYAIAASISRLRGYIVKNDPGFQYVEHVQGGVIPPAPLAPAALPVEGN
ncbi:MAG: hypothetical protein SaTV5_gp2 [Sanya totivirus 5]|nr:MAG: hypothetical protein SaTV5_gp2 [Sanya totivirus 5]